MKFVGWQLKFCECVIGTSLKHRIGPEKYTPTTGSNELKFGTSLLFHDPKTKIFLHISCFIWTEGRLCILGLNQSTQLKQAYQNETTVTSYSVHL